MDATGRIVREAKVASEPEALIGFLHELAPPPARISLEAGPLSQWLHAALIRAGHDTVLLETRHVKAALSAMIVKTDRKDARGIAQLLRMGWFRPVHAKSAPAQEVRALLVALKAPPPRRASNLKPRPRGAEIVGQHGEHRLARDARQPLHQEVCCAHAGLDRALVSRLLARRRPSPRYRISSERSAKASVSQTPRPLVLGPVSV